jgi:eukaryotic-like serine/threonine-protein kinase
MGNVYRLTRPATAAEWYRKSIALSRLLLPQSDAQHFVAFREEALASVLGRQDQAAERLRLLQHANSSRKDLASTETIPSESRRHMMRSYCKLSDAELAVNNVAEARRYSDLALPLLKDINPDSPSLIVLRDIGFCYESMGNLQRHMAAKADSLIWYRKSLDVWSEWNKRGAATPESELERHKVERLLGN